MLSWLHRRKLVYLATDVWKSNILFTILDFILYFINKLWIEILWTWFKIN